MRMHNNPAEGESPRDRQKRLHCERVAANMKAASEQVKARLKEEYEARADVQELNRETQETRTRRAIDLAIKARKEFNDAMECTDTTWSRAERETREMLRQYFRNNNIE